MGWLPDHIWYAQKKGVQRHGGKGWIPDHIFYAMKKGGGSKGKGRWQQRGWQHQGRQKGNINPSKCVWIGGLKADTTYQELKAHGEQAGNAKWAEVFQKNGTGVIGYATAEEAAAAISVLSGTKLKGATIQTDSYEKKDKGHKKWGGGGLRIWGKGQGKRWKKNTKPENCVWVNGIPNGTTYMELKAHGDEVGTAKWAEVHSKKGTGVIGYGSPEEAASAAEALNGSVLNGAAIESDLYERKSKASAQTDRTAPKKTPAKSKAKGSKHRR